MQTEDTTPETEVPTSLTEEGAASELLKRWGAKEQTPPQTEETEEAEAEQPQGDAEAEADPEPEAEESDGVEIDVGGEKFKLPPVLAEEAKRIEAKVKKIEAGATQRFEEAAETRKFAEAQMQAAQQLQKLAVEHADLIADHKQVSRRMQQIESADFNALAESDPVQLTRLNAEYTQLMAAKQRIEAAYQQVTAKSQEQTEQQTQARLQRLNEFASKNIKGWSDEYSQTLLEFSVKQLGADPQQLRSIMSEPVIKALDLAYRGWKVHTTDPKAKQVQATKTLKPGATGQIKSAVKAELDQTSQRLKRTGKTEDAAAALLARMKAKR